MSYKDQLSPNMMFQTHDQSLLIKVATGEIDAKYQARLEMANRGLGKHGTWVGFDRAYKEWGIKQ